MKGFIYLIHSLKIDQLYLGSTNDPAVRINEHNKGYNTSTAKGTPWECSLIIKMKDLEEARKVEYYIKRQKEKLSVKNVVKIINYYFTK